jgi:hypothetical protein
VVPIAAVAPIVLGTMTGTRDGGTMIERVMRAVRLDPTLYQEVDGDDGLTGEAFTVVALVGAISGLLTGVFSDTSGPISGLIGGAIGGVIGLLIGAGILLLIGKLFGGQADYMGLLRSIAYAYSPNVLSWIPFFGWVASIWALVCGVIAVRESHAVSTGAAVAIVLIPAAVIFGLIFLLALIGVLALFGLAA